MMETRTIDLGTQTMAIFHVALHVNSSEARKQDKHGIGIYEIVAALQKCPPQPFCNVRQNANKRKG